MLHGADYDKKFSFSTTTNPKWLQATNSLEQSSAMTVNLDSTKLETANACPSNTTLNVLQTIIISYHEATNKQGLVGGMKRMQWLKDDWMKMKCRQSETSWARKDNEIAHIREVAMKELNICTDIS